MKLKRKLFNFFILLLSILFTYLNISIADGIRCFCDSCVMDTFNFCDSHCEPFGGCADVSLGDSYCYGNCCCAVPWTIKCVQGPPIPYECWCWYPACLIEPREPGPPGGPTAL